MFSYLSNVLADIIIEWNREKSESKPPFEMFTNFERLSH